MANRLKLTCFKRTTTAEAGGPEHSEYILSDNENLLTMAGFNSLDFEPGKEYNLDFSKVIAPRNSERVTYSQAKAAYAADTYSVTQPVHITEAEAKILQHARDAAKARLVPGSVETDGQSKPILITPHALLELVEMVPGVSELPEDPENTEAWNPERVKK